MKQTIKKLMLFASAVRLVPHVLVYLASKNQALILADVTRWSGICLQAHPAGVRALIELLTYFPEYRNLFYYRTGFSGKVFGFLCPPMSTLCISTPEIGPGLFIQHGLATIIAARKIGANCWINQQVTIGFSNASEAPTLLDGVVVNAGAKVIGGVTIGAKTTVGANAVVVKDVPPHCTVVGVPARIIRRNGIRVDEAL